MEKISCIKPYNKIKIITWYLVLHFAIHIGHIQDYIVEWDVLYFFFKEKKNIWLFCSQVKNNQVVA